MIRIPDLTRIKKAKGVVHPDLKIDSAFDIVRDVLKKKYHCRSSRNDSEYNSVLKHLYTSYFGIDDVVYRRDLLSELLDNSRYRKSFNQIIKQFPSKYIYPISRRPAGSYGWSDEKSEATLRSELTLVRRYLELPETIELCAELEGNFEGSKDIRAFGKRARTYLAEYSDFVKPLKRKLEACRNAPGIDISGANKIIDAIEPYRKLLGEICKIKGRMRYYLDLCLPYEVEINGQKIVSCKPELLDQDLRKGELVNAHHPAYFSYGGDHWNQFLKGWNVPNSIKWGSEARNTFIQGPNSMGKSVYLQTIGLNVHLVMAGLRPFAESCEMSPVDVIYPCFDMGDSDDAGHFLTGMNKINKMLNDVTLCDLVLMDETGGGAEPQTERAIAKGLSDALIQYKFTSFNVTHDKGAWTNHTTQEGVRFMRVANLNATRNRYNVWEGVADSGYSMELASKKGLNPISIDKRLEERSRCK